MRISIALAALVSAVLAAAPPATSARTRTMMCAICGTVIDADPIFFPRDKLPAGAAPGTIVGAKFDGPKAPAAAIDGLVGRDARRSEQGDDARGLRLEIRMDGGGRRIIEIGDELRVYRRDRVRVHSDHVEVYD